jgi:hypothetical protein
MDVAAGVGAGPPACGVKVGVGRAASGAGLPGDVLRAGDVALASPVAGVTVGAAEDAVVSNSLAPAASEGDDCARAPAMAV